MTRVVLGPCSPFSVSTDLLKESAKLARAYKVSLHTHLCETWDEERYTLEKYRLRPVAWMETLDWLGDDVWFAHAIHVDDDEIRQFASNGVGAARCPAPTCARLRDRAREEVPGGRREGRAGRGRLRQQRRLEYPAGSAASPAAGPAPPWSAPPEGPREFLWLSQSDPLRAQEWMTAREALEIATRGGAAVLGRTDIGSLEAGKCATSSASTCTLWIMPGP